MRQRKQFIFILCCIFLNCVQAQINKLGLPFSEYFPSAEYKGGIQNLEITQSPEGIIYVANNFGMLSFNGTSWDIHRLKLETKCRYLLIGQKGKVYVAGQGDFGYFTIDSTGQYLYKSLSNNLPEQYKDYDETWRIFKKGNELIFCTFDYLFYFNTNDELLDVKPSPADIESFYFLNNAIYVNQQGSGILKQSEKGFELIPHGDFFSDKKVSTIIPILNNELLVATQNSGLYIINSIGIKAWNKQNQQFYKDASINTIIRMSDGNFAIGTLNDGLIITDKNGNIKMQLTKGHGLENRTILSIFEDMQNNLWLGHNNGISLVELNNPFSLINEQSGLPGTGYDAFLEDKLLYLGTNNGLFYKNIDNPNNLPENFTGSDGQVYEVNKVYEKLIIGHHAGTFTIEKDQVNLISDIPGAWTFLPLKNHRPYILQGNYKGLALFKKNGNKIDFIRKIKGFSESSRLMEQADNGDIWMTHGYKGVFKFKLNDQLDSVSVKYYGEDKGLPSKLLINVWRIDNKLIFSTEEGIYTYNNDKDIFEHYPAFDEYIGAKCQIISMTEDPVGNIYYVTTDEMGVLEKNGNGQYTKHSGIFNRIKTLLNDDLQKIIALEANQVLFAAKEGFIHYNNQSKSRKVTNLKTLITDVSITHNIDSTISHGRYLTEKGIVTKQPKNAIHQIPYKNNAVRIAYSAPYMEAHERTMYQYWLENSEEDGYSEWNNKTEKEYTNLSEGEYIFHVRAKDVYGDISEESTYTFIITPPWYRSTYAYTGYISLAIILVLLIYFFYEKRFQKKTEKLTEEKEKEINRIDTELKPSEELIDKLKNEKLKAQIDVQNKELATSTMQIINKNEFINSVKGNLNTVIKRSKNQEVKQEINKIIGNIEKNIESDKDWESFSMHFDKVHGDFTHRFKEEFPDISPQEMKLSAYLRMNLSTKEIAHLLNISVRGVEIARYRLRKKLQLERSDNLQEFILKY